MHCLPVTIRENYEPLIEISGDDFLIESQYYKQGYTGSSILFARSGVIERLLRAQDRWKGVYRLKILDAYRPRALQKILYENFLNELKKKYPEWTHDSLIQETCKFVASPYQLENIPPHTTGGAVDVTLTDSDGNELDMGTSFDSFLPEAAPFYFELFRTDQTQIIANRSILRDTMIGVGFTLDTDEWWHFDYGNQNWATRQGKQSAIYGELNEENLHTIIHFKSP